jgi:hypothetical protein
MIASEGCRHMHADAELMAAAALGCMSDGEGVAALPRVEMSVLAAGAVAFEGGGWCWVTPADGCEGCACCGGYPHWRCSHGRRRLRGVAPGFALALPAYGGAPRRLIGSVPVLSTPELARPES